jgi:hypothetical protein
MGITINVLFYHMDSLCPTRFDKLRAMVTSSKRHSPESRKLGPDRLLKFAGAKGVLFLVDRGVCGLPVEDLP